MNNKYNNPSFLEYLHFCLCFCPFSSFVFIEAFINSGKIFKKSGTYIYKFYLYIKFYHYHYYYNNVIKKDYIIPTI